ncbi:MAG: hypothetical protein G8237_05380 [Magnetococcales bacterium]|nr:hypothetical protein [Magnetococcales bacterium]
MINYGNINPNAYDEWEEILNELLAEANEVLASSSIPAMQESIKKLNAFISWNDFKSLDQLAEAMIKKLTEEILRITMQKLGRTSPTHTAAAGNLNNIEDCCDLNMIHLDSTPDTDLPMARGGVQ